MSNPRVVYRPREGATLETELSALASVYAFILQRQQVKQKADEPTPEPIDRDGTTVQGDSAHAQIVPE